MLKSKEFLFGCWVLIAFLHYANSTIILNNPKATMQLYSSKWSGPLTHINSHRLQRTKPIKMILHGFNGNAATEGYMNITEKYLQLDYQVIAVNYQLATSFVDAYKALPDLAEYLAHFIKWLHYVNLIPIENIHMIGYSLGGQIAGMTGYRVSKLMNKKIGRITALDPTRIGFESVLVDVSHKLDPTHAKFVEVVHTDLGTGVVGPEGHVDFYPNGGSAPLPGCTYIAPKEVLEEIPSYDGWDRPITIDNLCSHMLARQFFAESILSDNFKATKCTSWLDYTNGLCAGNQQIIFGENTNLAATGNFYFATQPEWPYYIIP